MLTPTLAPPTEKLLTGPEAWALGDIGSYELIEGKIVPMSPTKHRHGKLELRLGKVLAIFVDDHRLGEVQTGEVGIYIRRNPDTVRAADVLFISNERLAKAAPNDFLTVAPELVAEIVSPDDRWSEIRRKVRDYVQVGVKVVLILDPQEQTLSVYHSLTEVRELTPTDTLTLPDILPGFSVPVADLF